MNSDYRVELELAKQLAERANSIAMKYYKTELQYKTKADTSPVTIADEEINQMVIDTVTSRFPDDGILGEEQSRHGDKRRLWVCDPIDGTVAFSIGLPTFMFSLALVDRGIPVVAVASNPVSGEVFWAVVGKGAYLNDKSIKVSIRTIEEAWILYPTKHTTLYKNQELFQQLTEKTYQAIVVHGSVFKGALIAQGLADGSVHPETGHPWDFAAISLIIKEAGGQVTDVIGKELHFDKELSGVISSNGIIHRQLLDITNSFGAS